MQLNDIEMAIMKSLSVKFDAKLTRIHE